MPRWLSSTMIFIGFIALIVLAILPRHLEVNVTTNVKSTNESKSETVHHHFAPAAFGTTVKTESASPEKGEE
ncbi:MAG: hypothetical protein ACX939_07110 [Hyphococcus sp.]